jgi:hypothetical protein
MPVANIIVGDLIMLSMGNRVPTDMRIVQAWPNLKFDHFLLTRERSLNFCPYWAYSRLTKVTGTCLFETGWPQTKTLITWHNVDINM